MNTLQLESEILSLHSKSEPNFGHTRGSGQAQLRLGSEISELSPEPSQCEMPQYLYIYASCICFVIVATKLLRY